MSNPYRIDINARAERHLREKLPESVAAAAVELILGGLTENPHRLGDALQAPFEGLHSARRGTFRITYRINEEHHIVEIISIKHRRDAYRR